MTAHADRLTDHARLLVSCPDGHGIVAAVAGLLSELGAIKWRLEDRVLVHENRTIVFT